METNLTGTKEWAEKTVNIQLGCKNNCKYCYAKKMAVRYKRIQSEEEWNHPIFNRSKYIQILTSQRRVPKTFMFPSSHDIDEENWRECFQVVYHLLNTGNYVLVVSKPCMAAFIHFNQPNFLIPPQQKHLELRFTIGTWDDHTRQEWEPDAPSIIDRLKVVDLMIQQGFKVSISMEPLLETHVDKIFAMVNHYIAIGISEIWIGAMNYTKHAPTLNYHTIYDALKEFPQVRWKESFRKHLTGSKITLCPLSKELKLRPLSKELKTLLDYWDQPN